MIDPISDSQPFATFVYSHEGQQYVARKDYERLRDMMRWIPCDERLPNDGDEVLYCIVPGCPARPAVFDAHEGKFWCPNGDWDIPTHWMPLPEPPQPEAES